MMTERLFAMISKTVLGFAAHTEILADLLTRIEAAERQIKALEQARTPQPHPSQKEPL